VIYKNHNTKISTSGNYYKLGRLKFDKMIQCAY
jgi:hypothetical protein